jgi:hypothetical protein
MSILIFNKSPKYVPYKEWLTGLDEEILMLVPHGQAELYQGDGFAEVIEFESYTTNGCVEWKALELHEQYKYHTILANGERDLVRAGKLRDLLKLKGQSGASALAFRDKTIMKTYAGEAGIAVPRFRKITDTFDIISFVQENGFPVVIKPVDGSGSENTAVVRSRDELEAFLQGGVGPGLEIEQFIPGDMYHVDGLVIDGEVVFIYPSILVNGCLSFQSNKAGGSHLLSEDNPLFTRLVSFTRQVLNALPTPANTAFHAEIFHTSEEELVLCEIASRTGGAKIMDNITHAFGINMKQIVVQAQCGVLEPERKAALQQLKREFFMGFILIPPQKGIITQLAFDDVPEWVVDYHISAKPNQSYRSATKSTDNIAWFSVKGDNEHTINQRLDEILTKFDRSVSWQP